MKFSHAWMSDTHPEALRVWLKLQSQMTCSEKLTRIEEMWDMINALQAAEIRKLYPNAGEREVFLRMAARRLTPEEMLKVYGWRPPE